MVIIIKNDGFIGFMNTPIIKAKIEKHYYFIMMVSMNYGKRIMIQVDGQ